MRKIIDDNKKKLSEYMTGTSMELARFLDLALMMAEMVCREHRQTSVIGCLSATNIYILWDERLAYFSKRNESHAPYRSPEQSGRLNQVPDERSDLYSLGVIYYELLTSQWPIRPARDEDWEIAHIGHAPQPLSELRPELEGPLQAMVMKLLAKSPADRYQSAYGVLKDLQRCRGMLDSVGKLAPFEIAQMDTSGLYRPSYSLYGSSEALRQLELGFEEAAKGELVFRWVTGEEGIGKTALVHQLQLTVARQGGSFAEGECQPLEDAAQYAPLVQALRQWIQQFWSEPDAVVLALKERLQAEFGQAARTIVTLLPEAAPFFDCQSEITNAGSLSERGVNFQTGLADVEDDITYFGQLLPRFIRCLARSYPLVLFVDCLEHADAGTVAVIHALMQEQETFGLLLIGACRTGNEFGEVGAGNGQKQEQFTIWNQTMAGCWLTKRVRAYPKEHVALLPFGYEEISQLVTDALDDHSISIRLLARTIYNRTGGSPGAAMLLMEEWIREKKLLFDDIRRRWTWDKDVIQPTYVSVTDLHLMKTHFDNLREDLKELLAMAAAIGMSFRLSLLSEVSESKPDTVLELLHAAEMNGVIGREDGLDSDNGQDIPYLFLHEQLHQLAYTFDAGYNAKRHWRIGKLLQIGLPQSGDALLRVAIDHLNLAVPAMTEQERQQLAVDNSQAVIQALRDGDYASGKRYAEAGLQLIAKPREYESGSLHFELKLNLAWSVYMSGNSEQAKELLLSLLESSDKLGQTEKLQIWTPLIQMYTFGNGETAIQLGKQALEESGWQLKEKPPLLSLVKEVTQTQIFLYRERGKHQWSQPVQEDEEHVIICGLMLRLAFPMILHNVEGLVELYARFIRIGIPKGLNESLICIIGTYEILLQRTLPSYAQAGFFTKLTSQSDMEWSEPYFNYRIAFIYGMFKQMENTEEASGYLLQSLRRGMDVGDIDFVNMTVITCLMTHNRDVYALDELVDYFSKHVRSHADVKTLEIVQIAENYAAALRDESVLERFITIPEAASGTSEPKEDNYSYCCKLEAAYLIGRYREALHWAKCCRTNELAADWARIRKHRLYETLTLAALYKGAIAEERRRIKQAVRAQLRRMEKWKGLFGLHSTAYLLMKAEWARILGKQIDALREYMAAVKQAKVEKNALIEGIVCERLASYYEQDILSESGAMIAWMDACTAYSLWGVTAKVTHIRSWRADLLQVVSRPYEVKGRIESDFPRIQLTQPNKGAELEVSRDSDELLEQIINGFGVKGNSWQESFLEVALSQSGADLGVVLSYENNSSAIVAQLNLGLHERTDELYANSVVQHTVRTNESLVLYDAVQSYFVKDRYILLCQSRSILCMPIAVPGTSTLFILYLENRHMPGVFTNRDLSVLELIATRTIYIDMLNNKATNSKETSAGENREGDHVASATSTMLVEQLTEREAEILSVIAEGLSNREIAERFGIAETTVKTHTTRIFGKLGVKRRGQAVALAKQQKIID